jgi:hypothetical protein
MRSIYVYPVFTRMIRVLKDIGFSIWNMFPKGQIRIADSSWNIIFSRTAGEDSEKGKNAGRDQSR